MLWTMSRRLFVLTPLTKWLLGRQEDATPGASPQATPGGQPGGLEGTRYTSPTYGWCMDVNPTDWEVMEDSTDDGVDTLTLRGLGGAPTAIVIFRTSPPEFEKLEEKMLEIRKVEIPEAFPEALVTVGEAVADTRPIYGLFQDEGNDDTSDDHWIASYVARHAADPSPDDRIIELDIIGLPAGETDTGTNAVLTIDARSNPDDYFESAYERVEELRHSFYERSQAEPGAVVIARLSAVRAGGGSRPVVQY